jgi:uncharacterized protein YjbJ (UPF0337 family)
MDKDRVAGAIKQAAGNFKQVDGKFQNAVGGAKDELKDA